MRKICWLECVFEFLASPARPCSVVGPMMPPASLIQSADVIVVPLQPTNEQLFGEKNDGWYLWVRKTLSRDSR